MFFDSIRKEPTKFSATEGILAKIIEKKYDEKAAARINRFKTVQYSS